MALRIRWAMATMAFLGPSRDLRLKNFTLKYDFLALTAAQATSIKIVLRLPLRTGLRPECLFPALSLFPGQTPAHEHKEAVLGKVESVGPVSEMMAYADMKSIPGISFSLSIRLHKVLEGFLI